MTDHRNILLVFGHHDRRSLNGAMLDITVDVLTSQGHHVVVSDLHAMKFNPVIGRHDIKDGPGDSERFNYPVEMTKALEEGRIAPDLQAEQDKLRQADLLILQFPLYWMGFPAILKGWIDRVFAHGFAFSVPDGLFGNGKLSGKKALLSLTVGAGKNGFSDRGVMGDMDQVLWHLQNGIFRFTGMDVLAPHVMYGMDKPGQVQNRLDLWRSRVAGILEEKPLFYFPGSDFTEDGQELKQEVVDRVTKQGDVALTVGQHMGLRMPKASMDPEVFTN